MKGPDPREAASVKPHLVPAVVPRPRQHEAREDEEEGDPDQSEIGEITQDRHVREPTPNEARGERVVPHHEERGEEAEARQAV